MNAIEYGCERVHSCMCAHRTPRRSRNDQVEAAWTQAHVLRTCTRSPTDPGPGRCRGRRNWHLRDGTLRDAFEREFTKEVSDTLPGLIFGFVLFWLPTDQQRRRSVAAVATVPANSLGTNTTRLLNFLLLSYLNYAGILPYHTILVGSLLSPSIAIFTSRSIIGSR
eukprot:6210859-Pleurochrysis_carterae.AAC.3